MGPSARSQRRFKRLYPGTATSNEAVVKVGAQHGYNRGWRRRDNNRQDRQRAIVHTAEGRERELHRREKGAAITARRCEQRLTCWTCDRRAGCAGRFPNGGG